LGWVIGTPLPAGGAIVFSQTGTEASETSIRVCHSDQCDGAVTHPAPATLGPWIWTDVAVDRKGAPLVLSVYFGPPASAVALRCQDAFCEDTSNFIALATDQNVGDAAVGFDENVPVLAVAVEEGFQIGRCDRAMPSAPNCSSDSIRWFLVEAPDSVRGPKMIVRPDGSPTLVVFVEQRPGAPVAGPEIIMAVSCHDPTCEERTIADLAVVDDALAEWDIAMTPEGLLSVAWTERGAVRLAHCDDALCETFRTVDPDIEGVGVSIDYRSDGSPVVAVHSRERGLELVYCGDRDCSVPE
ncbi:MAG: hypothetical protein HKN01_04485, partial [Acidimicrobiia bacterium]|nr:hypothetical protein [Acidimicrobiia bacterium]